MKKLKNFDINVPELGDVPDITQVSDGISGVEEALAGSIERMRATIVGTKLELVSDSRTTQRSRYYNGLSVIFEATSSIQPNVLTTVTVDSLPEQPLNIAHVVTSGDSCELVYDGTRFNAKVYSVPRSNEVNSSSEFTVGTSRAVKTAYDKGIEALNKANTAQSTADTKVSKTGDTMTGTLTSTEFISNGNIFANGTVSSSGGIVDSGSRVYSPVNKPTSSEIGAVSKSGDTMTGALRINNPSEQFSVSNAENGFTYLEGSHQIGANVFLGGTGTRWYSHSAGQGFWRDASDNIHKWGIHKDGSRVLEYDFTNSTFLVPNMSANHLYMTEGGTIHTSNNYGIMGKRTDGVNKYMLLMDTANRVHLGWNKEADIVIDANNTFFTGVPIIESETSYMYFKDTRSGASSSRSYIGFGSVANQQKLQIINASNAGTIALELRGDTQRVESNVPFQSNHSDLVVYQGSRKGVYASGTDIGLTNETSGWLFKSDNAGNCVATGNLTAYSDIKLKKDLEIIPNAIDKIQALNGYTYTRKDTGERQTGVVAQEVQKVLPEAVQVTKAKEEDKDQSDTLTVAYGNMVGLLIEGIKELKAEIEELKKRVG